MLKETWIEMTFQQSYQKLNVIVKKQMVTEMGVVLGCEFGTCGVACVELKLTLSFNKKKY